MGQAALKYDDFDELDQVPIPEGGIATFLTAETGSWADDEDDVPSKGITNVVKIADKLAEYGRNEDEYMVHAAEGETVIPMEVFNQNPALKDKLFAEMRIMGIEPERYVVGNKLNSINPVTGQPEFFIKKLFRGLKKIVKKVLPVVATIVLSAIGVPPPMAAAIVSGAQTAIAGGSLKDSLKAAAIGGISSFAAGKIGDKFNWAENGAKQMATQAAINTTLSGGKPRDILKSAAIAGATTKGMDFLGGKLAPAGADATATIDPAYAKELSATNPAELARLQGIEGVTVPSLAEAAAPAAPATPITPAATTADAVSGQVASTLPDVTQGPATQGVRGPATQGVRGPATDPLYSAAEIADMAPPGMAPPPPTELEGALGRMFPGENPTELVQKSGLGPDATVTGAPGTTAPGTTVAGQTVALSDLQVPGVGESIKTIIMGDGTAGGRIDALKDLFLPSLKESDVADTFASMSDQDFQASRYGKLNMTKAQAVDSFMKEFGPKTLRKFGPGVAAVLGLSALSKPEEVEGINIDDIPSGQDLIDADPSKYRIFGDDFVYQQPQFTVRRSAGNIFGAPAFTPSPIQTPPAFAAEGGGIMNFPRMNGPIEGPGTETSDDIPAMLSDGEFVFTARAVRGAGKGSREDGMKNMYNMMRQFEARV
jgi:hypothetical protein